MENACSQVDGRDDDGRVMALVGKPASMVASKSMARLSLCNFFFDNGENQRKELGN